MDINSVAKLQDLRIRIANKEKISAEEMFSVLQNLRAGRRAAAEKGQGKKLPKDFNADDILNSFVEE